jgi:hypothetical protein
MGDEICETKYNDPVVIDTRQPGRGYALVVDVLDCPSTQIAVRTTRKLEMTSCLNR